MKKKIIDVLFAVFLNVLGNSSFSLDVNFYEMNFNSVTINQENISCLEIVEYLKPNSSKTDFKDIEIPQTIDMSQPSKNFKKRKLERDINYLKKRESY